MSWTAAAIVGGSVLGGMISADAAGDAADTQAAAADRASAVQQQMFNTTRNDLAPWRDAGTVALNQLQFGMGLGGNQGGASGQLARPFSMADFEESPAYQFNLQQGQRAIANAAARNKTLYAPATLQDVGRFSQGLASNEFQNAMNNYNQFRDTLFNRLHTISGSGQNAAAQIGAFGSNAAGQIGSNIIGAGNAQAAGQVGQANAINGAIGQGTNAFLTSRALQNQADFNDFLRGMQQPSVSLQNIPQFNFNNTGGFGGGGVFA